MANKGTAKWTGCLLMVVAAGVLLSTNAFAGKATDPLGTALSRAALLSGLTGVEQDLLKPAARLLHGKAGQQVIRQGSDMGQMLIVLDGRADIRIDGNSYAVLSGQILLGEIEFLDGQPATADVVLLENADYISLDNAEMNRIMEAHPRIGYVLIREIARIEARRLRKASTR